MRTRAYVTVLHPHREDGRHAGRPGGSEDRWYLPFSLGIRLDSALRRGQDDLLPQSSLIWIAGRNGVGSVRKLQAAITLN
jgi:hypothetical protein